MKKIIYTTLSIAITVCLTGHINAQNWRSHKVGLPTGFTAKTAYGEGTSIIVTSSSSTNTQIYYTPDSSAAFNGTTSSFGVFPTMESEIVKCRGLLFVGLANDIYKSRDNGHNWTQVGIANAAYSLYAHNDTLYLGNSVYPQRSLDTGNTWATMGYTGSLVVSMLEYNGVLYVGSTNGLQYTSDFGTTWHTVSSPGSMTAVSIVNIVALAGNVYAACSNGVYKSTDNGATWTNVLARDMFCLSVVDTSLLGGTATNGIFQSSHDGTQWTAVNNGLPYTGVAAYDAVRTISYNDNFLIANVAGDSAIYVTDPADLGLHPASIPTGIRNPTMSGVNCTLYPNPAKDIVTITFDNNTNDKTAISICDITGRSIKAINYDNSSTINIDLKDMMPGVYFLNITKGEAHFIKKVSIIK